MASWLAQILAHVHEGRLKYMLKGRTKANYAQSIDWTNFDNTPLPLTPFQLLKLRPGFRLKLLRIEKHSTNRISRLNIATPQTLPRLLTRWL